jgi:hypothetical protein
MSQLLAAHSSRRLWGMAFGPKPCCSRFLQARAATKGVIFKPGTSSCKARQEAAALQC